MNTKICLSHILSDKTPTYGNRDKFSVKVNSSIENGETANSSGWTFSNNHLGTHIDVPFHFCINGKRTYDYNVDFFFFKSPQIIDIQCNSAILITPDFFKTNNVSKDVDILLIRTGYEKNRYSDRYWNDNPGLSPELADYFRKEFLFLRCVGFDFISLTSWKYRQIGRLAHKSFLCPEKGKREILVIEDMTLKRIKKPLKNVVVAPLYVQDGNGGAVTVFAETQ